MRRSFFDPKDNRTGFFKQISDGEKLFELLLLLIQVTSKKTEGLPPFAKQIRKEVTEKCEKIYNDFCFTLSTQTLYKIAHAHSEERIFELRRNLGDPLELEESGDELPLSPGRLASRMNNSIAGREPIDPLSFTDEEKEEAKKLLVLFQITYLKDADLTPETVCNAIKSSSSYELKNSDKHRVFFDVLFQALFQPSGLFDLRNKINTEKYSLSKLQIPADRGQNIGDLLIDLLCLLFGVIVSTQEQCDSIESLSGELDKKLHNAEGRLTESMESSFGQITKNLPRVLSAVMNLSDDRDLREKIAKKLIAASASSHNEAVSGQRILKMTAAIISDLEERHLLNVQNTFKFRLEAKRSRAKFELATKGSLLIAMNGVLLKRNFTKAEELTEKQKALAATEKKLENSIIEVRELSEDVETRDKTIRQQASSLKTKEVELVDLKGKLKAAEQLILKKDTLIVSQEAQLKKLRAMVLVGLNDYRETRRVEAVGRRKGWKPRANHRHGHVCWGYTYEEKDQAGEMFKQFVERKVSVSQVRQTVFSGGRRTVLGAWKNKRLAVVISEHARSSLSVYGVSRIRKRKGAVIDQWLQEEQRREQRRAQSSAPN